MGTEFLSDGWSERGGLHVVDYEKQVVLCGTDAVSCFTLCTHLAGSSEPILIGASELPLYRDYMRIAFISDPIRRLVRGYEAWKNENFLDRGTVSLDEYVFDFLDTKMTEKFTDPSGSYRLPQSTYLTVAGGDLEVDALFDLAQASNWMPFLQRRFGFDPMIIVGADCLEGNTLSSTLKAKFLKEYAADYTLFGFLKGRTFQLL